MAVNIGEDAEIARIRLQVLGADPPTPDADYAYLYALVDGIYVILDDASVVGPFLAKVAVKVNGTPIGDGTTLDFVAGAGIAIAASQASPTAPIITTITNAGAPRSVSGTDTVTPTDSKILLDATGGGFTLALGPALDFTPGQIIWLKKVNAANTVTINPDGSETIDGAATATLTTQWDGFGIYTDGNEWFKV